MQSQCHSVYIQRPKATANKDYSCDGSLDTLLASKFKHARCTQPADQDDHLDTHETYPSVCDSMQTRTLCIISAFHKCSSAHFPSRSAQQHRIGTDQPTNTRQQVDTHTDKMLLAGTFCSFSWFLSKHKDFCVQSPIYCSCLIT